MKNEARKSKLLTLTLVILLAAALVVVIISILHKPAPVIIVVPDEQDDGDYTFYIDEDGNYIFPPDIYTLMDGPQVTLTHRTAGGYEVWEGTDPDGEKIMLLYALEGKRDFQYIRGSTQSGVGDFFGFDTWHETGVPVMRVYDKWRDGLVAVPASISEDGETMTFSVPDIWRAGHGR